MLEWPIKAYLLKLFHMGILVNLFSDFDFERGRCTLMHLRMLPDASVHLFNLLTASNSFQWNELSVVLVYQWCLKGRLSSQYCEIGCCYFLFLMPVIKLEAWWMLRFIIIIKCSKFVETKIGKNINYIFIVKIEICLLTVLLLKRIFQFTDSIEFLILWVFFCSPRQATHMEGDVQCWV